MTQEIEKSLATEDFTIDPSTRNKTLRAYVSARFCQLRGEYWTLTYPCEDPKAQKIIEAILENAKTKLTYDDVLNFEKALLKLWSLEVLRRRAWEIRSDFRDLAEQSQYDLYLKSSPPNPDDPHVNEILLRDDLQQVQNRLHQLYFLLVAREQARSRISIWLVSIVSTLVAAVCILMYIDKTLVPKELLWHPSGPYYPEFNTLLLLVIVFGAVGGFMSVLRRLQRDSTGGNPLIGLFSLSYGYTSIMVAPINGAIFAVILFLMFSAGIIKGSVFPEIRVEPMVAHRLNDSGKATESTKKIEDNQPSIKSEEAITLSAFLYNIHPLSQKDYAALLIWSFIAGFAEQFLPDTLDRLAAQKKITENTKAVETQRT